MEGRGKKKQDLLSKLGAWGSWKRVEEKRRGRKGSRENNKKIQKKGRKKKTFRTLVLEMSPLSGDPKESRTTN